MIEKQNEPCEYIWPPQTYVGHHTSYLSQFAVGHDLPRGTRCPINAGPPLQNTEYRQQQHGQRRHR